jgi:hypothetical protein
VKRGEDIIRELLAAERRHEQAESVRDAVLDLFQRTRDVAVKQGAASLLAVEDGDKPRLVLSSRGQTVYACENEKAIYVATEDKNDRPFKVTSLRWVDDAFEPAMSTERSDTDILLTSLAERLSRACGRVESMERIRKIALQAPPEEKPRRPRRARRDTTPAH